MLDCCPNCNELIDSSGFFEHGVPTLWYCTCRKIYRSGEMLFELIEIPSKDVDLTEGFSLASKVPEPGQFIHAARWEHFTE